jgi:hypothetical protein
MVDSARKAAATPRTAAGRFTMTVEVKDVEDRAEAEVAADANAMQIYVYQAVKEA